MPSPVEEYLEEGEVVEREFKLKGCRLYLTDRRLILIGRGGVRSCRYRDVSLVHVTRVSRFMSLPALAAGFVIREIYRLLKPMPPYLEYVFLAAVLACAGAAIYWVLTGGDYIEIYVSGLRKPLRIKGEREELERVLKIINKTIRKRR